MSEDILSVLDPFVAKAQKLGADEVEFYARKMKTKTVNFEANNLKSAVAGIASGVGIRVLKNKSLGFSSVNSLDKQKVEASLKSALAIAKVSPPQDNYTLPKKQPLKQVAGIFDEAVESFTMDDTINAANRLLETSVKMDKRITVDSGTFAVSVVDSAILASSGIAAQEKKSTIDWLIFGMAVDGEDIGSFDYSADCVVKVSEIDVEKTAQDFAQKVLKNLGAKKTAAFEGQALLSPEAAAVLFNMLIYSAKATTIQSGSSFLQDKVGSKIASEKLTIVDDGSLPNKPCSSMFDREGVPHKELRVVDKGTFTGVLYDTFSANKENVSSTGHARGSYRGIPNINPTNITIKPGSKKLDEIISEMDKGIFIQRISASPDYVSGDYSGAIKGGQLVENGEQTLSLKEITAVGNLYTSLESINQISKDYKLLADGDESWLVPYVLIDNIKFTS